MDLSREAPSPALREEFLERLHIEAGTGDVTGRISLGVKGSLLPVANLLVSTVCTIGGVFCAWALFHLEGTHPVITLSAAAAVGFLVWRACCAFLRHR
ncbi:hypothetical protein ACWEOZ_11230 [Actinoplanes sp. NPDC004185]